MTELFADKIYKAYDKLWFMSRQPLEGKIRLSLIYPHFSPNLPFFYSSAQAACLCAEQAQPSRGKKLDPGVGRGWAKGNVEKFPSKQLNQKYIPIQYTPKKKKDCQMMKMKTHFHHEC